VQGEAGKSGDFVPSKQKNEGLGRILGYLFFGRTCFVFDCQD
jgi:hypothetical protein